jgi:hypothetical protein
MWPTPDTKGFTNDGSLRMPAYVAADFEEFAGMAHEASGKKKKALWPMPRTNGMCGGTGNRDQLKEKCADIEEVRAMGSGGGGQLNADWEDRLMGYPDGWTDIDRDDIDTANRYPAAWLDGSWDTIPRLAVNQKNSMARIKGLGDAVVPQVTEYLWRRIAAFIGG